MDARGSAQTASGRGQGDAVSSGGMCRFGAIPPPRTRFARSTLPQGEGWRTVLLEPLRGQSSGVMYGFENAIAVFHHIAVPEA